MAKKQLYFAEAERLYVIEQKTFAEIATQLNLAERTIRLWAEEADWKTKRLQYLKSKQTFHEELYQFARMLMSSIKEDMTKGTKVDAGRMYTFTRILPLIVKIKDYEDTVTKVEGIEKQPGLTEEVIKLIQENILGM